MKRFVDTSRRRCNVVNMSYVVLMSCSVGYAILWRNSSMRGAVWSFLQLYYLMMLVLYDSVRLSQTTDAVHNSNCHTTMHKPGLHSGVLKYM